MVSVPHGTWDKENTTFYQSSFQPSEETINPPPRACLNIKVVYNQRWVEAAGNGDFELALCEAIAVMKEAEKIYNDRFDYLQYNRLGIGLRLNFVSGGTC